jgi:hypothetical protein
MPEDRITPFFENVYEKLANGKPNYHNVGPLGWSSHATSKGKDRTESTVSVCKVYSGEDCDILHELREGPFDPSLSVYSQVMASGPIWGLHMHTYAPKKENCKAKSLLQIKNDWEDASDTKSVQARIDKAIDAYKVMERFLKLQGGSVGALSNKTGGWISRSVNEVDTPLNEGNNKSYQFTLILNEKKEQVPHLKIVKKFDGTDNKIVATADGWNDLRYDLKVLQRALKHQREALEAV